MIAGICVGIAVVLVVVTAVTVFCYTKRRYDTAANAPAANAPAPTIPTQNVPAASTDEYHHYESPPDAQVTTSHHNPDAAKYETIKLE